MIEARVAAEFQREKLGNLIHFFVLKQPEVRYVALIPKGEHVTVTAIGTVIAGASAPKFLDARGREIQMSRLSFSHF